MASSKTNSSVQAKSKQLAGLVKQAKSLQASGKNSAGLANSVNKSESMLSQTKAQGSKSYKGSSFEKTYNATPLITAQSLQKQETPTYPEKKQTVVDPINLGTTPDMQSMGYSVVDGNYQFTQPKLENDSLDQSAQRQMQNFMGYIGMKQNVERPNMMNEYAAMEKKAGIQKMQNSVNQYTQELNSIVNTAKAQQLQLEGQGRGISDVIIGGQQAQIQKEAAIKALPVQALLDAAQGNLEMAQARVDKLFAIRREDLTNEYNFKQNLVDSYYNFLTDTEKQRASQLMKIEDRNYQEKQNNVTRIQQATQFAITNGQHGLVTQLGALDPSSATFQQDFARIQSQMVDRNAELDRQVKQANIAQSYASIAASKAAIEKAKAEADGYLSYADNQKFNSTPQVKAINDSITYTNALNQYRDAINKYGTGEWWSDSLNQTYSALVGATKDYYNLGTYDNGVEKLIDIGIKKPSIFGFKSARLDAIDTALTTAKDKINQSLTQLDGTAYAPSVEYQTLKNTAQTIIGTQSGQNNPLFDPEEMNIINTTFSGSTPAFNPASYY